MELGGLNASCPDLSYAFPKNIGTSPLSKHIKSKHPEHQARQAQISILGDKLDTLIIVLQVN